MVSVFYALVGRHIFICFLNPGKEYHKVMSTFILYDGIGLNVSIL